MLLCWLIWCLESSLGIANAGLFDRITAPINNVPAINSVMVRFNLKKGYSA